MFHARDFRLCILPSCARAQSQARSRGRQRDREGQRAKQFVRAKHVQPTHCFCTSNKSTAVMNRGSSRQRNKAFEHYVASATQMFSLLSRTAGNICIPNEHGQEPPRTHPITPIITIITSVIIIIPIVAAIISIMVVVIIFELLSYLQHRTKIPRPRNVYVLLIRAYICADKQQICKHSHEADPQTDPKRTFPRKSVLFVSVWGSVWGSVPGVGGAGVGNPPPAREKGGGRVPAPSSGPKRSPNGSKNAPVRGKWNNKRIPNASRTDPETQSPTQPRTDPKHFQS